MLVVRVNLMTIAVLVVVVLRYQAVLYAPQAHIKHLQDRIRALRATITPYLLQAAP